MNTSQALFNEEKARQVPVECLGQTFVSDEARRQHFLGLLRTKLEDPEFRKIEGFPVRERRGHPGVVRSAFFTACQIPSYRI